MEEKKTKPILTALTSEFLVMSVEQDKPRSDLSTLLFSAPELENWLKSWAVLRQRLVMHLNVSWNDIKGSRTLKKRSFPLTLSEDGLKLLTDVQSEFPEIPKEAENIFVCLAISKTAKQ